MGRPNAGGKACQKGEMGCGQNEVKGCGQIYPLPEKKIEGRELGFGLEQKKPGRELLPDLIHFQKKTDRERKEKRERREKKRENICQIIL